MKSYKLKVSLIGFIVSVFSLVIVGTASAHVVVTPAEVLTASRATFAVSVPNEHDTPVVAVRVEIPQGLTSVRPYAKQGWNIEVVKTGDGEDVTATEIKWTSAGATVPVDLKDDFLFGAKAPADATELKWKAYETYADGTVVSWDQDPSEAEDNKPYSVTKVISETATTTSANEAKQAANDAQESANRALYVGIAGVVLGLAAIFLATRRKR